MFTKQHYRAIADIIRECTDHIDDNGYRDRLIYPMELADRLAEFFQEDNPRFDSQKWFDYLENTTNNSL